MQVTEKVQSDLLTIRSATRVVLSRPQVTHRAKLNVTIKLAVWTAIDESGTHGLTCDQVEEILGLPHTSVSARVRELVKEERIAIEETAEGATVQRTTRRGVLARVYVVTKQERGER